MPYRDPPSLVREPPRASEDRRLSLPLLENLYVASPCPQSWDEMAGDERVRFCWRCEKNVYNLSALSREEAEQLVFEREGAMCARFYRRSDGTILTSDCPPGRKRSRWLRSLAATAAASVLALLGLRPREPAPAQPHAAAWASANTGVLMEKSGRGAMSPAPGILGMLGGHVPDNPGSRFTGFEILERSGDEALGQLTTGARTPIHDALESGPPPRDGPGRPW